MFFGAANAAGKPHDPPKPFLAMMRYVILATACLTIWPQAALSHRQNESYVYFNVTDAALSGRVETRLSDLDAAVDLDADDDGEVSRTELQANAQKAFAFFAERLALSHGGRAYPIVLREATVLGTEAGAFAQLWFDVPDLSPTPEAITVAYRPLADVVGPEHLGFALIESNTRLGLEGNESRVSLVFDAAGGGQELSLVGDPLLKVFRDFVIHGIWHIWLGFDHVVFLLTLLLPAVMRIQDGAWRPQADFRIAFWTVLKIVTVFTISHSVTLSLAALGVVELPSTLVEAVIAASIAAVALMNLFPSMHRRMLWVVFGFGLFHGFGFANVLAPLGLAPTQLAVGLAAFNIGVEIGQIAIVAAAFPVLWVLRRWSLYDFMTLKLGSLVMIGLAGVWLLERTTTFEWNVRATIATLSSLVS